MKRKTIRNHRDFITSHNDVFVRGEYFVAKTKVAKIPTDARYGIVASKNVFKSAVDRNRAKRLLRDWIFFNENLMMDDFDYIFIANHKILNATREKGRDTMGNALKKIINLHKTNAETK